MDLGSKIRNLRYLNGLTQDKLAKMIGINRNCLSRIETNKVMPSIEVLISISKVFNISLDSFLDIKLTVNDDESAKKKKLSKVIQYTQMLSCKDIDFIIGILNLMLNK